MTPITPSSADASSIGDAKPLRTPTPLNAKGGRVVWGRVLTPENSKSQLKQLTDLRFGPGGGEGGVKLGGSWFDLQRKREEEVRLQEKLRSEAAEAKERMNRIEMINEDLMARALRDEMTIGKLKCIEIGMENKYDDLVSENDQLRLMHRKVVADLEESRAVSIEQGDRLERLTNAVDRGRKGMLKVELEKDNVEEEGQELKVRLVKVENMVKKLKVALDDEKKRSGLYLKLKDDKDAHINLLIKEKNRLHDMIQDLGRRHEKTTRTINLVEKTTPMMASPATPQTPAEETPGTPVDLDMVVNSPYEHAKPTALFLSTPEVEERNRVNSLEETLRNIDASSGSGKDRLLLNTIKKLSRDMKRKDEEMREKDKLFDGLKMKNDDLNRRIRNAVSTRKRRNNLTPTQGKTPN